MSFDPDDLWVDAIQGLNHLPLTQRRRIYRVVLVAAIGLSYLFDTLLLLLFSYLGTIRYLAPLIYGLAGLGHVIIFSALHWTGVSERFANRQMTVWQMIYAVGVQLLGITFAPQIAPFFMAVMFIIFAFGTLKISFREALFIWLFSTVAVAVTITRNGDAMLWLAQHPGKPEYYLAAISFSLILLRTIMLGYYATMLRQRMYEKGRAFEQDATHDALTGILNRRMLPSIIDEHISLLKRKHIPACVAMIDIDRFKSINDIYGHAVGDVVLKSMVSHLRWGVRESDKLIRYGGEEFVLVLAATDMHEAGALLERIRRTIALQSWLELDEAQKITISIGFCEILPTDQTGDPVMRADQALYEAKHSGRDKVVGFSSIDLAQPAAEPR